MTTEREVLIVDADDRATRLLARGFQREGWKPVVARRASDALAYLEGRSPELILAEADLADGNGFDFCEAVKRDASIAEVPFFIVTRREGDGVLADAKFAGAEDVVGKPVFVKDLVTLGRIEAARRKSDKHEVDLGRMELAYVLRAVTAGARGGEIRLAGDVGRIAFKGGAVVDARYKELAGERALLRMLTLQSGVVIVDFGAAPEREAMRFDARALLGRGFAHTRRWRQVLDSLAPLDAVLAVDFAALAEHLEGIPDDVNSVIKLFDGRRTLEEVVDASGLGDLTALEVVAKLDSLGIVKALERERKFVATAPALFEPAEPVPPAEDLLAALFPDGAPPAVEVLPPEALAGFAEYEKGADPWESILSPAPFAPAPIPLVAPAATTGEALARATVVDAQVETLKPSASLDDHAHLEHGFFTDETTPVDRPLLRTARKPLPLVAAVGGLFAVGLAAGLVFGLVKLRPTEPVREPVVAAPAPAAVPAAQPAAPSKLPALDAASERAAVIELLQHGQVMYDAGDLNGALGVFEEAAERAPDSPAAALYLGLALYEAGDAKSAAEALRHARALDPKNARAAELLGAAYQELGENARAKAAYEAFLKLEPAGKNADDVRGILPNLP